jgi:Phosphotransferase enzyme family
MSKAVEHRHLLLGVASHGVILGKIFHELSHARAQLVGELRRGRPGEGVDVGDRRLATHVANPNGVMVGGVFEERISRLLDGEVVSLRPVETRGYAAAYHAIAEFDDGRTCFVKAGAEEVTSGFLRDEIKVYRAIGEPFMAALLGADEGDPPLLVLEDLSGAFDVPPWTDAKVAAVLDVIERLRKITPPAELGSAERYRDGWGGRWQKIAEDPAPFLSLGLCSREWLRESLPVLAAAAAEVPLAGEALVHIDVRSDNLAFVDGRAKLVDWNFGCAGHPQLDLACWLPSLHAEGGPPPEALMPEGGARFAAFLAGVWGAVAGLPPPPTAPGVRAVQLAQLRVVLPWAARELGLKL